MAYNFQATLCRGKSKKIIWTRRFKRFETVLPRSVQLLALEGKPNDVIEIAHAELGFQIAVLTIHAAGKLSIDWTPLLKAEKALHSTKLTNHSQGVQHV